MYTGQSNGQKLLRVCVGAATLVLNYPSKQSKKKRDGVQQWLTASCRHFQQLDVQRRVAWRTVVPHQSPGSVLLRSRLLRSRVGDSQERPSPTYQESDKPTESDDDDTDEEEEEEDPEQVLETQRKRNRAAATHFDASPASGKEQPKKKAKTATTASAEFKPPSRSGAQPSRGTVASPSGTSAVARSLGSRLSKVAGPKKK